MGKDYVQAFNQMHNKINVLKGEESKLPWSFNVIAYSPEAANEINRRKTKEIKNYISFQIQKELSLAQARIQQQVMLETQQVSQEEAEQFFKQRVQELEEQEKEFLNPEEIINKYRKFRLNEEIALSKILINQRDRLKLRHLKNESYEAALVAGIEAIKVAPVNGIEQVEVLNPLGLAYHKSPEIQFIEDGDWVVYKQEKTIADVIDEYGDRLHPDDLNELETRLSRVYGTDAKMYSKDAYSPSHWENLSKYNRTFGFNDVPHTGQYGQSVANYHDYLTVYTCYWRSQRKVYFLSWVDDYGNEQMDIVSEDFIIPENHTERRVKDEVNNITKKIIQWLDPETQIVYSLEEKWIPQIWEGTRIEDHIYVDIQPVPWINTSIERPYDVKLPIYGAPYSAKNAPITSLFDRGVPWQKLYLFVMAKWLKLIQQDRGVVHTFNTLMVDEQLGIDETLRYMFDMGFIPINPIANAEAAQILGNTLKMAETINLSNSNQLSQYTQILAFIEQQIGISMGVPREREARTSPNTNVTDNQQDLIQSSHITQPILALHNIIWENVLNALLNLTKERIKKGAKTWRFILSDEEIATIEISPENLDNFDFGVYVKQNEKAREVLKQAQLHAQALIQNDKLNLSTFIGMLETENLGEFKQMVRQMENELSQRELQLQQQRLEAQAKQQEREIEWREDQQQHEIAMEEMKGNIQKEITVLKEQSKNPEQKDDTLELKKLEQKEKELKEKIEIERKKILQKQKESDENIKLEKEKLKLNEKLKNKKS
ncbi:MAG: hypothetical protein KatS3mg002_1365 [Candidatus Woesearchaeota archaeon]|nr:MAG: hypothetical protein KatS3mg002_1365 [Candidatus Woesearchaeota archaeon]